MLFPYVNLESFEERIMAQKIKYCPIRVSVNEYSFQCFFHIKLRREENYNFTMCKIESNYNLSFYL